MPKRILIIRFSSIGDIVLTTPVVRSLARQLGAEIYFLTKAPFAGMLQANPYIHKVLTLQDRLTETLHACRLDHYDHIVDLHHNFRSARIKRALKAPTTSFHKLNFEKWLLVNFKIDKLPASHIVDRYLQTVAFLGIQNDHEGLDFFLPNEDQVDVQKAFGFKNESYASVVVGAAHETKCMTSDQIAQLCDNLQMPVVLLGGKQEFQKANAIVQKAKSRLIKIACGGYNIMQSASILQQSATIITHDTGMMHIAAALKKPQVVVWGNTIPGFGMYPYYGNADIKWISFDRQGLYCKPCTKLGYQKCPEQHFKCMLDHNMADVASAALSFI